jgi:AbrB family looped-hinge helix DNA binding protein
MKVEKSESRNGDKMVIELRAKSQLTIPRKIVEQMNLSEGDQFEIYSKGGEIHLVPVVVYPKRKMERLNAELEKARAELAKGDLPVYDNIDEAIKAIGG